MLKHLRDKREFLLEGNSFLDLFSMAYIDRKSIYEFLKNISPMYINGGKLIDFGCGEKPYKELFHVNEYIGVDIEVSGHSNKNKIVDVFYDGEKLPFDNETFDSAVSFQVFEHVFNARDMIHEVARVLTPNGIFIITVPLYAAEHEIPYDFFRYTEFGIQKLLEESGFEIQYLQKSTNTKDTLKQLKIFYLSERWHKSKKNLFICMKYLFVMAVNNLSYMFFRKNNTTDSLQPLGVFVVAKKVGV